MQKVIIFIVILLFIPFFCFAQELTEQSDQPHIFKVKKVINGDMLELENGETVSLIGIDCPEMNTEEGKKAKEFTKELVEGKEVRLEFDVQKKDKHGRLLAYVYFKWRQVYKQDPDYYYIWGTSDDGYYILFLNATIIKEGYAQPMTVPLNVKYTELFAKLYKEALLYDRGFWKDARVRLKSEKECLELGGKWDQCGMNPIKQCNLPTTDAGKTCKNQSECQGACFAELTEEQKNRVINGKVLVIDGKCSAWKLNYGCNAGVQDGKVNGILCKD